MTSIHFVVVLLCFASVTYGHAGISKRNVLLPPNLNIGIGTLSDRAVLQIVSLIKPLLVIPKVTVTLTSPTITTPLSLNLLDIAAIKGSLAGVSGSVYVVVGGYILGPNSAGVKALAELLVSKGNTVISIGVEVDSIVQLLKAIPKLASLLKPLLELLPLPSTTIIGVGAGAHLAGACIGLLPPTLNVQAIIALDPILPLLETTLYLSQLIGRAPSIIAIHTSLGSYTNTLATLTTLALPGITDIYLNPADLTPICLNGLGFYSCLKGWSLKILVDIIVGRGLAAPCNDLVLDYLSPAPICVTGSPLILTLGVAWVPGVLYYVDADLIAKGSIIGLTDPSGLVGTLLTDVVNIVVPLLNSLLGDILVIPITNLLGNGLVTDLLLGVSGAIDPILDVAGNLLIAVGNTVDGLLAQVVDLLGGLLGTNGWDVSILTNSLTWTLNNLLNGGLVGDLLDNVGELVGDVLDTVGDVVDDVGDVVDNLLGSNDVLGLPGNLLGGIL